MTATPVKMNGSFDGIAAMTSVTVDLTAAGEPVRLLARAVSPSFFDVLRVRPIRTRLPAPGGGAATAARRHSRSSALAQPVRR
jgi:hypothetical protein